MWSSRGPTSTNNRPMKPLIVFALLFVSFLLGCTNAARPVAQNTNSPSAGATPERAQTAIAHGPPDQAPNPTAPAGEKSKWTQSGDPIDTTKFDAKVMSAEKALSGARSDASAKKELAAAYLERAVALTEVRQYASALGDYRRVLKYDPANAEAQKWIDQIISIYGSINRSYPQEGEEPPPLPFTKPK